MYTDGYKKAGKYPNKYDTSLKRKNHYDGEMKFAHAKAETKAYVKTIRELACLQTGYKTEALKEGHLYFCKIRRSREVLKLETAARLQAMARGITASPLQEVLAIPQPQADDPVEDVFGDPIIQQAEESKRDRLITVFEYYLEKSLVPIREMVGVGKMIAWLKDNLDAEQQATWWAKAIENLRHLEASLPQEARCPEHGLY